MSKAGRQHVGRLACLTAGVQFVCVCRRGRRRRLPRRQSTCAPTASCKTCSTSLQLSGAAVPQVGSCQCSFVYGRQCVCVCHRLAWFSGPDLCRSFETSASLTAREAFSQKASAKLAIHQSLHHAIPTAFVCAAAGGELSMDCQQVRRRAEDVEFTVFLLTMFEGCWRMRGTQPCLHDNCTPTHATLPAPQADDEAVPRLRPAEQDTERHTGGPGVQVHSTSGGSAWLQAQAQHRIVVIAQCPRAGQYSHSSWTAGRVLLAASCSVLVACLQPLRSAVS